MAGRIRDDDIALVRERARIDDVVADHLTLRPAGGGSLKGLCPFHDEKTPSFHVTPARGFYHCFGCQRGGDVITFVQEVEGVGFTEAVERLASRYGVQLRYVDDDTRSGRRDPGQRARLVQANGVAADFYQRMLHEPDGQPGREFLQSRGFAADAARTFGVGFAPRSGEALVQHLRSVGVHDDDAVVAGLVARGGRGLYDRFRGRLVWPIREVSGDVVGFGARRLFDDDRIEAKYLNTPETPLYKKSSVLYGVDLARKEIARTSQAVVVEGYTDVMACHLAGVRTAVATCGTAFGEDHSRVLRRLLLDHDEFRGEVIFTFDGDEAGRRAALRAFGADQQFASQTYVAVEPDGRDPCDLRLADGDAAVRELIARRIPLYRFVLASIVTRYDLDRADSRIDAVRDAARLVASVRDKSKIEAFVRELAGMVGADPDDVRAEVRRAVASPARSPGGARGAAEGSGRSRRSGAVDGPRGGVGTGGAGGRRGDRPGSADDSREPSSPETSDVPDPLDRRFSIERDLLKVVLQYPQAAVGVVEELEAEDFVHPYYRAIFTSVMDVGGPSDAAAKQVAARVPGECRTLVTALSVEGLPVSGEPDRRLASAFVVRLQELTALRRIASVKARLQRMNPVTQTTEYNRLFGELIALESHRHALREEAIGSGV